MAGWVTATITKIFDRDSPMTEIDMTITIH